MGEAPASRQPGIPIGLGPHGYQWGNFVLYGLTLEEVDALEATDHQLVQEIQRRQEDLAQAIAHRIAWLRNADKNNPAQEDEREAEINAIKRIYYRVEQLENINKDRAILSGCAQCFANILNFEAQNDGSPRPPNVEGIKTAINQSNEMSAKQLLRSYGRMAHFLVYTCLEEPISLVKLQAVIDRYNQINGILTLPPQGEPHTDQQLIQRWAAQDEMQALGPPDLSQQAVRLAIFLMSQSNSIGRPAGWGRADTRADTGFPRSRFIAPAPPQSDATVAALRSSPGASLQLWPPIGTYPQSLVEERLLDPRWWQIHITEPPPWVLRQTGGQEGSSPQRAGPPSIVVGIDPVIPPTKTVRFRPFPPIIQIPQSHALAHQLAFSKTVRFRPFPPIIYPHQSDATEAASQITPGVSPLNRTTSGRVPQSLGVARFGAPIRRQIHRTEPPPRVLRHKRGHEGSSSQMAGPPSIEQLIAAVITTPKTVRIYRIPSIIYPHQIHALAQQLVSYPTVSLNPYPIIIYSPQFPASAPQLESYPTDSLSPFSTIIHLPQSQSSERSYDIGQVEAFNRQLDEDDSTRSPA
jgi:hypothetical protein